MPWESASNPYYTPAQSGPNKGLYGSSSLFPQGFYQGQGGNSAEQNYWNSEPGGAFTRWLSEKQMPMNTAKGRWAQGQFGDIRNAFAAAQGDNPEMMFYGPKNSFLNTVNLEAAWRNLSSQAKGLDVGRFATRARMLPRGQ